MKQASIYFDKDKYYKDEPMTDFLMEFLVDQGVIGATLFRGEAGIGENHQRYWLATKEKVSPTKKCMCAMPCSAFHIAPRSSHSTLQLLFL